MVLLIKKRGIIRSAEDEAHFEKIMQHPLLQPKEKFKLFKHRYWYYHIFSLYYFVKDNKTKSLQSRKTLLKLYEDSPNFVDENKRGYLTALNNYILVCQQTNNAEAFLEALDKLKKTKPASKEESKTICVNANTQELLYYYYAGKFSKAADMAKDIDALLEQHGYNINISNRILFYFVLGCSFLRAKSYNTAIHYINLLLNLPDAESVQDLYRFTRIIQLVIHFELGNFRLIESLSQSTQRLLKYEKKLFGVEVLMLELFIAIAQKNGEDNNNELLKAAYKKLKEEMKNPFEQRTLAYFNFVEWFEEKLHKKVKS
jgi:hypothetical protein